MIDEYYSDSVTVIQRIGNGIIPIALPMPGDMVQLQLGREARRRNVLTLGIVIYASCAKHGWYYVKVLWNDK